MTSVYIRPDGKNRFQIRSAALGSLPSAWLDQEFNKVYGILNGFVASDTVSVSEWTNIAGSFTQISSTSFSVSGDMTQVFEALRAIQFTDENEATTSSHIQSSSYDSGTGLTTVIVYDAVVPATISKVSVGLVSNESAAIPSVSVLSKSSNYTIGATDEVILCDDTLPSSYTIVYDDGQVGGDGYPALLITLPIASSLPHKLLCVKKIAGTHRTIVSSAFVHSTSLNSDNETVHTNTYDFQILGDNSAKNRVELKGVGDCYWFVSNGTNWYELTPEASETEKGIVRFATDAEMTLTAQQIADGEDLAKDLAVSTFNVDKHYLRTDASNMLFASNYIYTAPNGVASLINNNIVVYEGLGLSVPTGRDDNGVSTSKKLELDQNLSYAPVEVTAKSKLMFVKSDKTLQPVLAQNYFIGYNDPVIDSNITTLGDSIIWFDFGSNLLKLSTDNGSNWTTFDGAGPICEYYGNGVNITNILPYAQVGFLTRDNGEKIYRDVINRTFHTVGATIASGDANTISTVGEYDLSAYIPDGQVRLCLFSISLSLASSGNCTIELKSDVCSAWSWVCGTNNGYGTGGSIILPVQKKAYFKVDPGSGSPSATWNFSGYW
jgi:hypothetical protein